MRTASYLSYCRLDMKPERDDGHEMPCDYGPIDAPVTMPAGSVTWKAPTCYVPFGYVSQALVVREGVVS